ncbi:MAG: hypothetical protein ACUVX8_04645 [Candidatus Zipacnadales bacterium]
MRSKQNIIVAIIVVVVCIASMLLIYKLTVGSKVSMPAKEEGLNSLKAPEKVASPPDAGGTSGAHAVEVEDKEAVTKPASEKQSLPPGVEKRMGE